MKNKHYSPQHTRGIYGIQRAFRMLIPVIVFAHAILACIATPNGDGNPLEITQTVIVMQQTQTEMANGTSPSQPAPEETVIFSLTEIAASTLPPQILPPTNTPLPTGTPLAPKPTMPSFTATENMFCRDGPAVGYERHYTLDAGKTVPVLAKWHTNNWFLVGINDSSTRTKCCWVGGDGSLNVSLSSLLVISHRSDRIDCPLHP